MLKKTVLVNHILFLFFGITVFACSSDNTTDPVDPPEEKLNLAIKIPAGANSWVINNTTRDADVIFDTGIHNWTNLDDVIRTYFKTESKGELHVGLRIKSPEGTSKIKVSVGSESKELEISNSEYKTVEIGKFNISSSGYHYIEIQGMSKPGTYFGDINDIFIGGPAASSVTFVPTDNFHFGRRGPSVHMSYEEPQGKDIKWFYNEVTVPEGEDVIGSFFMANGHAEGYFGMQVNSASERRVLFSIWSAFNTDDPNQIPEDYKVLNLGNGDDVTVQDFGNEGSGKQSFKVFNWKADTTYKFLLKAEPSVNNSTDYTAYFFAPEVGEWQLIASLRRPQTSTYLKRPHSFLENFVPSTGFMAREVLFGNQWAYTTDDTWVELNKGTFTADATASQGHRLDFTGGAQGDKFFLKNCGFFDENGTAGTAFTRTLSQDAPDIDFSSLKVP
ncbi:DUF3472 domain-containing protein [Flagellimonas onchidii]|uniref:DUF3472 domain-containing protein n=1 Tax=Flagellimonas onchidii TaxID=2562684 RepID=UPI0010A648A4|nr:DUF3472 domain-containing protein [Allomuricauda onchidii]